MRQRTLSKNAIKRAVKRWDFLGQHEGYSDTASRQSSAQQGARDAIVDANRMIRLGRPLSHHPDGEDFFGVCLSDSTSGRRYVDSYNEAMGEIIAKAVRQ